MRSIRHPLSGGTYDLMEDGTVQVVDSAGRTGVFDTTGGWLSGDVRQADPHLCLWIAGKQVSSKRP